MMAGPLNAVVPVEVELAGLLIRPGDTLVLRYSPRQPLSQQHAEAIKGKVKEQLPDIEVLIIQAEGLSVYRPEPVSGDDEHTR
jgi:hypothetical protein